MSILVEDLTVSFHKIPAIHHINLNFKEGESWAICGPNGAGKSTLMNAIMGLLPIDTGHITLQNLKKSEIAYLPQMSKLNRMQPMSVYELVATGLWYEISFFRGINHQRHERVLHALRRVGMQDVASRQISALSNGQFKRVLFARMLVQDARFLLLDEPFNAIDANTTSILLDILKECQQEGKSIIAILHDYEQVRFCFSNTVLIAREVIALGQTEHILSEHNLAQALSFRQNISRVKEWCDIHPEEHV